MTQKTVLVLCASMMCFAILEHAFAGDRDTPTRDGQYLALPAGEAIDAGLLVGVCSGKLYKASSDLPLSIVGRSEMSVASNATLLVRRGLFRWGQYTTNSTLQVKAQDIGNTVYVYSESAVAKSPPSGSFTNTAGKVYDVDSYGVWVRSGYW